MTPHPAVVAQASEKGRLSTSRASSPGSRRTGVPIGAPIDAKRFCGRPDKYPQARGSGRAQELAFAARAAPTILQAERISNERRNRRAESFAMMCRIGTGRSGLLCSHEAWWRMFREPACRRLRCRTATAVPSRPVVSTPTAARQRSSSASSALGRSQTTLVRPR
jgi:hypothetical protein